MKKRKIIIFALVLILIFSIIFVNKELKSLKVRDNISSIESGDLIYIGASSTSTPDGISSFIKYKNKKIKYILENIDKKNIEFYKVNFKRDIEEGWYVHKKFLEVLEFELENKNFFRKIFGF